MTKRTKRTPQTPQALLSAMHEQYQTWAWVAEKLFDQTGKRFDRALLSRIGNSKQNAPNSIRQALGLPAFGSAPVCPVHGVVHPGRCPRKTFEQRASDYDAWRQRNMPKLLEIVAWAEGKR